MYGKHKMVLKDMNQWKGVPCPGTSSLSEYTESM